MLLDSFTKTNVKEFRGPLLFEDLCFVSVVFVRFWMVL